MYSQAYGVLKYWLHFSVLLLVHGNRYLPVLCCHYTNGGRRNYIKCHHNLSYDKECRHQGNWCSIGTLHGNQLTNKNCLPHPGEYYVQAFWMAFLWTSWTCCQCRCGCVFIYSWKGDILNIVVKIGKRRIQVYLLNERSMWSICAEVKRTWKKEATKNQAPFLLSPYIHNTLHNTTQCLM